jgi:hypothetical protein
MIHRPTWEHWFEDVVVQMIRCSHIPPIVLVSYHRSSEPQQQQLRGGFPTETVTATKGGYQRMINVLGIEVGANARLEQASNDGPSRIHSQQGSLKKAATCQASKTATTV